MGAHPLFLDEGDVILADHYVQLYGDVPRHTLTGWIDRQRSYLWGFYRPWRRVGVQAITRQSPGGQFTISVTSLLQTGSSAVCYDTGIYRAVTVAKIYNRDQPSWMPQTERHDGPATWFDCTTLYFF